MVLVSAIIPVYNQERYLAEAIESVLGQTFEDVELIVVDDGSTDRTPEIIAGYRGGLRAFREPNSGWASALNLGIREARGEWIGWLSSDDLWEPPKLARQFEALQKSPSAGVIYTDDLVIDSEGRVLGRRQFPSPRTRRARLLGIVRHCFINGSSTLVRRDVFERVGLFDEKDRYTADYDLWLRIAEEHEFLHVAEPLVRYRIHPGQISWGREVMERAGGQVASRALRRMGPGLGALGAALLLKDELAILPWQVKRSGGGLSLANRAVAFIASLRVLVNPDGR